MKHTIISNAITLALASSSMFGLSYQAHAQESTQATDDVEVIMVSASRRTERLQDVPLAVAAMTGKQLQNSTFKDLTDIQNTFSGVQYGETPNDKGFRMRGIGTMGGYSSASESPVGLVVDNVVTSFGSPMESLGDIARIEVLKGPQGTQFGKNASAGVVNITTKKPDTLGFYGNVYGSYATLNEHDVHTELNLPISDSSAMSVYLFDKKHDGFVKNVVRDEMWGGSHKSGARVKYLWEISSDSSLYIIGDYSKHEQDGPQQTWTLNKLAESDTGFYGAIGLPFVDLDALGVTPGDDNDISIEDGEGNYGAANYGLSVQFDTNLGDYQFSSITAWREYNEDPRRYSIDGLPYAKFEAYYASGETKRLYSQEFRITSPSSGALEYVTGLYFSRQEAGIGSGESAVLRPALPYSDIPAISITAGANTTLTTSDSYAAYIDGKYQLADKLKLIGGLRLTRDEVEAENFSKADDTFDTTVPYTTRDKQVDTIEKTDISGRIGLEYKQSNDAMFFGTYARGYLGPTVTYSALNGTKSKVLPQTVDDYTIGVKSQVLDRKLTVNANVFYDKFNDLQTSVFDGQEFLTENAGGADTKGFEVELIYQATRDLALNLSYTYSDAKFTDYITECPTPIVLAGNEATLCNAEGSTEDTPLYQAKGEQLPGAPKHTAVIGMNYHRELGSSLLLEAAANASYRSETQNSVGDENTIQDGYSIVNLNVGISDSDQVWRVGLFARNLLDQNYNAAILALPFANDGSYVNWRVRNAERTVGIEASYSF